MADIYGEGDFQFTFVDDWMSLPDGMKLLECPGVAVDGEDRVFILTRGEHPIFVFDRDGNFIRTFGEGHFSNRTHGLYYSPSDNTLLAADDGIHTIQKFTPDGEKVMEIGERNHPAPRWSGQPFNRPTSAAIRQANGYTQEEFSRALSIKRDRYAKYELGISEPPFVILGRIVKLTGKSLDFLVLGDKSNMPVQSLDDSDLDENGPHRVRR